MKTFFLLLWGALSLTISTAALRALCSSRRRPAVSRAAAGRLLHRLLLPAHPCRLSAVGLLGAYRRAGYWLCLILLPLTLIPLHAAYEIWQQGRLRRGRSLAVLLSGCTCCSAGCRTPSVTSPLLVLCAVGIGLAPDAAASVAWAGGALISRSAG